MKYVLIILVLLVGVNYAQEKVETPKQKEVSAQFQKEVKELQDNLDKAILPLEGQKFRIDEQIKQLNIEAQKKLQELQNKYAELYKQAEKDKK